jgi:hypothetical protein
VEVQLWLNNSISKVSIYIDEYICMGHMIIVN